MLQTFREWINEQLIDEEEEWRTTEGGHKIAFDPKSGKITKGLFAGGNIKNLGDLAKNVGKFAGSKDKDAIIKSINKNANKTKGQSNKDSIGDMSKDDKKWLSYHNKEKRKAQQSGDKEKLDILNQRSKTQADHAKGNLDDKESVKKQYELSKQLKSMNKDSDGKSTSKPKKKFMSRKAYFAQKSQKERADRMEQLKRDREELARTDPDQYYRDMYMN